jgi:cell division protein FtsA
VISLPKKDKYIVSLDVGTSKICAAIGLVNEAEQIDVVGIGQCESKGLRKGVVVNMEETIESIKRAVEEAELMAGVTVESVHAGIAGGHIKGFNSKGVIAIYGKNHEISREDVHRVIEAAKAVSIPADREILHIIPQEFILDGQDGIAEPLGMRGSRLEANVHIVTALSMSIQNLVSCINRAGIEVSDIILEQLACSEAALTLDEKELGVALIDIGGGTTDIAIFERGSIWHTAVLPSGGHHFTNDIAVGLRTPIAEAEKIKKKYGCALSSLLSDDEVVEVPGVGEQKPRILSRQMLGDIIQPRAEEIFNLVLEEIKRIGYEKSLNAGLVLCGGGAVMEGMVEVAEEIFGLPARVGNPMGIGGLVDVVNNPIFAVAIGLILYAYRNQSQERAFKYKRENIFGRTAAKFTRWFTELFK